ncbi:hypothetical protein [Sphingomonas sp.]|uniref:hypothetical protein n=1 Tax=Sphingomonas sp. TaxID=28214 RepID=UPI0025DE8C33|nr:hypothetical protein [Sphingomonas sp.]MBV9527888.1 hypothetical protein [Sphingomonas sp.]
MPSQDDDDSALPGAGAQARDKYRLANVAINAIARAMMSKEEIAAGHAEVDPNLMRTALIVSLAALSESIPDLKTNSEIRKWSEEVGKSIGEHMRAMRQYRDEKGIGLIEAFGAYSPGISPPSARPGGGGSLQ